MVAYFRQFDIDHVGELVHRKLRDAHRTDVALQAGPLVRLGIAKRFWIHRILQESSTGDSERQQCRIKFYACGCKTEAARPGPAPACLAHLRRRSYPEMSVPDRRKPWRWPWPGLARRCHWSRARLVRPRAIRQRLHEQS